MMQILALVPGGIGDQILFFPALTQLKQTYPKAQIDVVVEPRSVAAYQVCASVRDTIAFDFKDRNSPADWGNLLGTIRDREYDAVLSLGRRWAVGLLLWLTGIPKRVGYAAGGKMFLTDPVPLNLEQYAGDLYHDLVRGFGITAPRPALSLQVPQKELAWAEAEQARLGIKGQGYLLVHGGSSAMAKLKGFDKVYPVDSWKAVLTKVQQAKPELPIVLVKGPDDTDFVATLQAACPSLKLVAPNNIGQLAAMTAGANVMLCGDSGPMHISVALGTYTIALFGPTDPAKLLPPGDDRFVAIKSPTDRMSDIPPSAILEKLGV
ncbi:MAG: glycosyltransferase family 9 protein [Limnothrix sp.]|nr:glycosyltransferase family 9 protein [Limnothrix sp.]